MPYLCRIWMACARVFHWQKQISFVKLFLDELVVYSVTCMDGYSVMDFIEKLSL